MYSSKPLKILALSPPADWGALGCDFAAIKTDKETDQMPFDLLITDKTPRSLLSQDQLFDLVPAAFTPSPAPKTTKHYDYVDTMQAVEILQDHGFQPVYAKQKPSRKRGNIPFASHLIAFAQDLDDAPHRPEILLWNSHDASQSLRLLSGLYRFACDNGIVCGQGLQAKLRHDGGQTAGFEKLVIDQAQNMPKAMAKAETMQAINLDPKQQQDFASKALDLRWQCATDATWDSSGSFWDAQTMHQALAPKRIADAPQNLWTIYNRLQEVIIGGQISLLSVTAKGAKQRQAKAVESLKETVRLNQGLWDLADEMA
jgi:hypothetical protein